VWHINPTGKFVIGGPDGDCGPDRPQDHRRYLWRRSPAWRRRVLGQGSDQGRPLGGLCRALSGQERCGRGPVADRCTIQLAYAIGVAEPLSVYVDLHGTGKVDEAKVEKALRDVMDLSPTRHPPPSRSQQADLRQDQLLRPFWTQGRSRRLLLLGKDRSKVTAALALAPLGNVRLYGEDATRLLDWLPAGSLAGIDLLYPDPWPKKKHWKRRFVSAANLDRFARVLKTGALFRFASDIDTYVNWTLRHCERHAQFEWIAVSSADWTTPYAGWPGTRYEAKALREGRTPAYLTFKRL
jgi:hypothetical protein